MEANPETLLGRLAAATRREPYWRVSAPPWLAKILVAGGAQLASPDVMVGRPGAGLPPPPVPGPDPPTGDPASADRPAGSDPWPWRQPGDQAGFDRFFRGHYRPVVSAVMFAGASEAEAESAAMNAMIEAYRSWPLLEEPAGWVRAEAIHDYLKSAQHPHPRPILNPQGHGRDADSSPPQRTSRSNPEGQAFLAAVGRLSSEQREVTALSMDGYHPAGIAKLLGQPTNNVRWTLRHACERLREDLGANA